MIINNGSLQTLNISFNAAFNVGLAAAATVWNKVAMEVPSSTRTEEYGWLGALPNIREWLGDRVVQGVSAYRYQLSNRDFEMTIRVPRNDIMDDTYGIYSPMFNEMGRKVANFPDRLVMGALSAGFTSPCYDGQYFFDTDHPVKDVNGNWISAANTDAVAGNGPAWFLLDTTRAIKPLIYQNRKAFEFVAKDKPSDDNVFSLKEYLYGVDGRSEAGFGLWQLAWGSMQPLSAENYTAARAAMQSLRGDYDERLGVTPNVLVVPPQLEHDARALLKAQKDAYGADNVWFDTADLVVTPWL